MSKENIINWCNKAMTVSFYLLFFLVPLVLTPINYELFEYNKMMLTYGLTIVIASFWLVKMVIQKKFFIQRTPFDIPLLLFFISQFISTIFSMDVHTSIWGYYTRSHGGLLSTISYITLYYALVTNISKKHIRPLIITVLLSGMLVSLYGVLEHFGIDKNIWVQDVQARVFSTLGQPNWLAAYLAVLIPICIGMGLTFLTRHSGETRRSRDDSRINSKNSANLNTDSGRTSFARMTTLSWKSILFFSLSALFYLTLLYTRSRSGFLAIWGSLFFLVLIFKLPMFLKKLKLFKPAIIVIGLFLLISFINGTPFLQYNKYLLPGIINPKAVQNEPPPKGAALDTGVTESGEIRKIVWQGAIDIIKANPLFGTGTETFAYAYYQYRPVAHNMVSEWDFLYNKAHNEYLNFGANNGLFGLGTYLLFIGSFIWWNIQQIQRLKIKDQNDRLKVKNFNILDLNFDFFILIFALFSGWLSILVTNFFGFSVVIIGLLFFLVPALSFVLIKEEILANPIISLKKNKNEQPLSISHIQLALSVFILLLGSMTLFTLYNYWIADTKYASGYNQNHINQPTKAFDDLRNAVRLNPEEPIFRDELANNLASLAVLANSQKEATLSTSLVKASVSEMDQALFISPNNINFYKSQTRLYYTLSQIDPKYNTNALNSIQKAVTLAPTDAKLHYNLALLYGREGDKEKAIETLEKTIQLKPNYSDAYYALALYYKEVGKNDLANNKLEFILKNIDPKYIDAVKKLDEWSGIQGASVSANNP